MATAMAAVSCSFSPLSRRSHSSRRVSTLAVSSSSARSPRSRTHRVLRRNSRPASGHDSAEAVAIVKRSLSGKERNEDAVTSDIHKHGYGQTNTTAFKSSGFQKKNGRPFAYDLIQGQQVHDSKILQDEFLNAVVKVYCTHSEPDYSLPWQKQRQQSSTGSAFMIAGGRLLTSAHCVEHDIQVKVKRAGDDTKFIAKVLARGIDCDLALLTVENEDFWKGVKPLRLGGLPNLQDGVTVVGYPLGGDTISVTKGVVSRIEVTSYANDSTELLAIQIDAAINAGNSGGPVFNDQEECIGVAFQALRRDEAENIGYVIPTSVVSHFLEDYERNGKYTGFPCIGVFLQKLDNPVLREYLGAPSDKSLLVKSTEPTSPAHKVLQRGDVIVNFDGTAIGTDGTVPFKASARMALRYLVSQKFSGDTAELDIIRRRKFMKVQICLQPSVDLVPSHYNGEQPSYLIVGGLVFTPLSEPLIDVEDEDSIGLSLLAKARRNLPNFKGEQIVILSQVLAHEVNLGYEVFDLWEVHSFNDTPIKNMRHLAHLVDTCEDNNLIFRLESNIMLVLDRKAAMDAMPGILRDNLVPSDRSADLSKPYIETEIPDLDSKINVDGLLWT